MAVAATTIFGCNTVRVSRLAVTISHDSNPVGTDYEVCLHSADSDFALRLAEALVAAHGRRTAQMPGKCAIIGRVGPCYPDKWDCAMEMADQTIEEETR